MRMGGAVTLREAAIWWFAASAVYHSAVFAYVICDIWKDSR